MIPAGFVPLINHLWQSTLFAVAVWLVTLALSRNRAGARYLLWLAASLKFLLPFSLFVALGSYAGKPLSLSLPTPKPASFVVETAAPFSSHPIARGATDVPDVTRTTRIVEAAIGLVWLTGFVVVQWTWVKRWRHAAAVSASAHRLDTGFDADMIRRLQTALDLRQAFDVAVTEAAVEPGLFGVLHPILLLPAGLQGRLTTAQLESILVHELSHLRRRDNLAAFIHTMIQAVFWFHPLVWWIGSRLSFERELACDEQVVECGGDRHAYAKAILDVCEFYVASSRACVSGISRTDLKKRIQIIVKEGVALRLSPLGRSLLAAAAAASICVPILFGCLHWTEAAEIRDTTFPTVRFVNASIKSNHATSGPVRSSCHAIDSGMPVDASPAPGHCVMSRLTLQQLIAESYGPSAISISGGADWMARERFDIESEAPDSSTVTRNEFRQMFRALLADRFKLALHRTTADVSGYALRIAEGGLKLVESPGEDPRRGFSSSGPGALNGRHMLLIDLARNLSAKLGYPVIDKTGLTANYNFTLRWSPGLGEPGHFPGASGPNVFMAIQEQMGLRLDPEKVNVEVLVIDHAERPVED